MNNYLPIRIINAYDNKQFADFEASALNINFKTGELRIVHDEDEPDIILSLKDVIKIDSIYNGKITCITMSSVACNELIDRE